MAPLNKAVFIDPLDVTEFIATPQNTSPGFTQDVIDTLGNAGDSTDGFDQLVAAVGQLIDGWDAATAAQDADLDAVLALAGTTNPAPLDTSFAGYVATIPYGQSLVDSAVQLVPPQLLQLPLSPNFNPSIPSPPALSSVDFGTVKLGSAPIVHLIGTSTVTKLGRHGIWNVTFADGDTAIFQLRTVQGPPQKFSDRTGNTWVDYDFTYNLVMTPAKLGKFVAQVDSGSVPSAGFNIITFSVNVVP
jgi:hypothetical protein